MSWPKVKLGDVAPAIPVKNVNLDEDELVWQLNLDQIESNTGKIVDKVKQPLSSAGSSTHFFNNEHVLYSKLRPYLNKVVVPDELGIATTELVPMKPDQKRLNKEYLAYYLRSKPFVEWVSTQVSGAKMPRVVMSIFWQHEMPLPPLYEQERIVSVLDKSNRLRQKREQAIKLADDFLRATFLEMFGDPIENPKGWNVKPLADQIVHANNGISRRRKEDTNEGDIVLRLQDVHYSGIAFDKELNRIKLVDKEKQIARVEHDDLLFIRVNGNPNYVGRTAVFKSYIEPVYHNDHLIRIKLDNEYQSDFLCYLINSPFSRKLIAQQIKTSAGQHTISQDGILKLMFYRPPIELQEKFINIKNKIESIFYRKDKHEDL
ncbi:restriction endonuclease subunit S, partial [Escherichia coli O145:H28]|nr:restriction endonuclease subunit S [Escherichia coli O145:H28]